MISVPKAPCLKATTYLFASAATPVRPPLVSHKFLKGSVDKAPCVIERATSRRLPFPTAAPIASLTFGGPSQVRTITTAVGPGHADIVPDFSAERRSKNKDPRKKNEAALSARVFTYMVAGTAAVPGIYVGKQLVQNVVGTFSTTKDVLALAKMEVSLTDIPEGKSMMLKWRGKPVFVKHRTAEEISTEQGVNMADLRDQQHDSDRTLKPDWLVVIGICTHLGCVPVADAGLFGGFYCPCHGSHYDASGRIRRGPAPLNLEVPEYSFPDDQTLIIG